MFAAITLDTRTPDGKGVTMIGSQLQAYASIRMDHHFSVRGALIQTGATIGRDPGMHRCQIVQPGWVVTSLALLTFSGILKRLNGDAD